MIKINFLSHFTQFHISRSLEGVEWRDFTGFQVMINTFEILSKIHVSKDQNSILDGSITPKANPSDSIPSQAHHKPPNRYRFYLPKHHCHQRIEDKCFCLFYRCKKLGIAINLVFLIGDSEVQNPYAPT